MSTLKLMRPVTTDLGRLWAGALGEMSIRHPDPASSVVMEFFDAVTDPTLSIRMRAHDTDDATRMVELPLGSTRLTYWPGKRVAQAWVAAAWAGYLMHEGLELVTANGIRPLCPHRPPYAADHSLRTSVPPVLTPDTLLRALRVALSEADARALTATVPRRGEPTYAPAAPAAN